MTYIKVKGDILVKGNRISKIHRTGRALLSVLHSHDKEFYETESDIFYNHLNLFDHFLGGSEPEEPIMDRDFPASDSLPIIDSTE